MELVQPWKNEPLEFSQHGVKYDWHRELNYNIYYKVIKEPISDAGTKLKRGDVVKFNSMYYESDFGDWRDWFLNSKKDKEQHWTVRTDIPKYAHNQYAILLCRYRITKFKRIKTFKDYTSYFMFITGPKIGKIKVYNTAPHTFISSFPYTRTSKRLEDILKYYNIDSEKYYNKYGNTYESRTNFVEFFQKTVHQTLETKNKGD